MLVGVPGGMKAAPSLKRCGLDQRRHQCSAVGVRRPARRRPRRPGQISCCGGRSTVTAMPTATAASKSTIQRMPSSSTSVASSVRRRAAAWRRRGGCQRKCRPAGSPGSRSPARSVRLRRSARAPRRRPAAPAPSPRRRHCPRRSPAFGKVGAPCALVGVSAWRTQIARVARRPSATAPRPDRRQCPRAGSSSTLAGQRSRRSSAADRGGRRERRRDTGAPAGVALPPCRRSGSRSAPAAG